MQSHTATSIDSRRFCLTQLLSEVLCLPLIGQNLRKMEGDTVDEPGRELNELQNADWVSDLPFKEWRHLIGSIYSSFNLV